MHRIVVALLSTLLACGGDGEPSDGDAAAPAVDAGGVDATSNDGGPDAGSAGLVPADPPPDPVFPDVIDTISVAVRTATTMAAGTDSPIDLCVNATTCFDLDTPDIDDRQEGLVDVFHFSGLALPRSMVDQVTLRSRSPLTVDNDRWTPGCLDLRFDGEPVYCNDAIGVHVGTGTTAHEVPSWTDPAGLTEACVTCWNEMLTHGPVQGGHGPDSLRIWVRADATRPVGLRMSEGPTIDASSPVVAWALPRPSTDFSAVLEIGGLEPGREYQFRLEVDGDDSQPVRAIRTAPAADDTSRVRFAFGSCSRLLYQPAFGPLLAAGPDLFLFLGDIHYANSRHRDAHRWRYRLFRDVAERAAFFAATPTLASWDDHDFVGNNSTGTCAGRDEALDAFTEYWANPPMGIPGTPGAFFRHRWGAIELFALDCRMYRPEVGDGGRSCADDPMPPALDPTSGPIGPVQWTWALDEIASSNAPFKLISCGSQFTREGSRDSWRSFPAARDALLDELARRAVEGVVLLSGDVHHSEIRTIARPSGEYVLELTSSPVANTNFGCPADTPELVTCFDADSSYIVVDAEASVPDPTLTGRIHDSTGAEHFSRTFLRSTFGP